MKVATSNSLMVDFIFPFLLYKENSWCWYLEMVWLCRRKSKKAHPFSV